jgi:hypothetical protein
VANTTEKEPRVIAGDLIKLLNRAEYYAPRSGREGRALAPLAEAAETSVKTLSRLLKGKWETVDLGLADRICVAIGASVNECTLDPPDKS